MHDLKTIVKLNEIAASNGTLAPQTTASQEKPAKRKAPREVYMQGAKRKIGN